MIGFSNTENATSRTAATASEATAFNLTLSYAMPMYVSMVVPRNMMKQRMHASFCSNKRRRAAATCVGLLGISSRKFLATGITTEATGSSAITKGTFGPQCFKTGPRKTVAERVPTCRPNHTKVINAGPCSGFDCIFSAYLASVSKSQVENCNWRRKMQPTRRPMLKWSCETPPTEAQAITPKTEAMRMYGALWYPPIGRASLTRPMTGFMAHGNCVTPLKI
mmetsp:Transcript_22802/g.63470  ORF Transcript_22802/g.63470 Transcript_22802/m.63470 type:complete len:222 (-) Transcript_22802:367-1032(-)